MAQQIINIGALPSDGSGDPLRVSFSKINQNFTELYSATLLPSSNTSPVSDTVTSVAGRGGDVVLTVEDVVDAASKTYVDSKLNELIIAAVDTQFNTIVDAAPEAMNSIRELAEAIQNDPNYYLSVSSQLNDKLSKSAGGTMYGALYLRDILPTAPLEATSKKYVDSKITAINNNLAVKQIIIDDSANQIASLTAAKADKTAVYTKGEIDILLAELEARIKG